MDRSHQEMWEAASGRKARDARGAIAAYHILASGVQSAHSSTLLMCVPVPSIRRPVGCEVLDCGGLMISESPHFREEDNAVVPCGLPATYRILVRRPFFRSTAFPGMRLRVRVSGAIGAQRPTGPTMMEGKINEGMMDVIFKQK
jgi:hypothetical protein